MLKSASLPGLLTSVSALACYEYNFDYCFDKWGGFWTDDGPNGLCHRNDKTNASYSKHIKRSELNVSNIDHSFCSFEITSQSSAWCHSGKQADVGTHVCGGGHGDRCACVRAGKTETFSVRFHSQYVNLTKLSSSSYSEHCTGNAGSISQDAAVITEGTLWQNSSRQVETGESMGDRKTFEACCPTKETFDAFENNRTVSDVNGTTRINPDYAAEIDKCIEAHFRFGEDDFLKGQAPAQWRSFHPDTRNILIVIASLAVVTFVCICCVRKERHSRAKERDAVDLEIMREANDEPQYTKKLLGEGGQGAVYECIYQSVPCALKKIERNNYNQGKKMERLRDETIVMCLFDHDFILGVRLPSPQYFVNPRVGDPPRQVVYQKYGWESSGSHAGQEKRHLWHLLYELWSDNDRTLDQQLHEIITAENRVERLKSRLDSKVENAWSVATSLIKGIRSVVSSLKL